MKAHWSKELIHDTIKSIAVGLGHFPTHQELAQLGRNDLSCKICKTGGYVYWSNLIGIARKPSASDTGWAGEAKFGEILTAHGVSWTKPRGVKSPYDILVDGVLRVDVKAAKYAEYGACKGWFYRIGKHAQADVIALVQLDTDDYYIIPWYSCPKSNVTISRDGGKYAAFANALDLLRAMASRRHEEKDLLLTVDSPRDPVCFGAGRAHGFGSGRPLEVV